jgi:enoyl-CoA hydratase
MVNRVVPRERLRDETQAIADKLAEQPRLGVWLTKQVIHHVEEERGKRTSMDAPFHMHHFAHAQNDLASAAAWAEWTRRAWQRPIKRARAGPQIRR